MLGKKKKKRKKIIVLFFLSLLFKPLWPWVLYSLMSQSLFSLLPEPAYLMCIKYVVIKTEHFCVHVSNT